MKFLSFVSLIIGAWGGAGSAQSIPSDILRLDNPQEYFPLPNFPSAPHSLEFINDTNGVNLALMSLYFTPETILQLRSLDLRFFMFRSAHVVTQTVRRDQDHLRFRIIVGVRVVQKGALGSGATYNTLFTSEVEMSRRTAAVQFVDYALNDVWENPAFGRMVFISGIDVKGLMESTVGQFLNKKLAEPETIQGLRERFANEGSVPLQRAP